MKILHITGIGSLIPKSGVPAVLKALIEAQNKISGVEARCVSLRSGVEDIKSSYFDEIHENNMDGYISKYKPDIAIFHSFFYIEFIKLCKILIRKKIPFAIEPHGSFGSMAMRKGWLKKQLAVHTVFNILLKKSNGYIYTNQAEREDSVFKNKNNTVIPNGVYEYIVNNASVKTDRNYPIFYYLGRYDIHHKGLDYLLSALSILESRKEDIYINFYGIGGEKEIKYVHKHIQGLKYVKAFEKGPIYDDLKKKSLEEANIMLLTSRYEGSPIAILDSLCYGNPCIVTPGTNISNEIVKNRIGWQTELDANSIANTIIRAKSEYQEDKLGYYQRSKAYVLGNYIWSDIAKFAVEEYKRFL